MTEEGLSLNSILDDEPTQDVTEAAPAEDTTEAPTEAPQTNEGPARGPDGKFVSKQQTGVDDTPPPGDKLPKEDYKAIREEREKRQNLERELEALKQQFQSLQQPKEPPAPPPSMWEDEQGWQQHFGGQIVSQAVQAATYQSKLATSEIMARQAHEDFGDVWEPMNTFLGEHPDIAQKAAADPHPWGYAYRAFKNATTMAELGATDLDALKAKMREELLAEMQAQQPANPQQTLPPTLTTERNVGNRSGPAWTGPKPLAELLG